MIKKIILAGALILSGLSTAQISLNEGFEGFANPWANSELVGPVFVSSEIFFCGGEKAAGAIVSSLLGNVGLGPKTMTSPQAEFSNNNQKLNVEYSLIIGQLNMTDFQTLEPIPTTTDWGNLKFYYSVDNGTTWKLGHDLNYNNYTSKIECTTINFEIPASEMGTGDNGFKVKFEASQKNSYVGILTFVIDELSMEQALPLSVNDIDRASITLYPNPATDYFTLGGNQKSITSATVYTMDGKLIKTIEAVDQKFDIKNLKPATYIISTVNNGQPKTFKLIKK